MKGPTTNVDLSLYISLQALNDSVILWRMFLYLPLQVIFELYNEALFRVYLSVVFFSVAFTIYLLLSILKFARLVQIQWLEVKHPSLTGLNSSF